MKFTKKQSQILNDIILHRRDVRGNNFLKKKIKKKTISKILHTGIHAPSVGFSQPWKFMIIEDKNIKDTIYNNFRKSYKESKKHFKERELYNGKRKKSLKRL